MPTVYARGIDTTDGSLTGKQIVTAGLAFAARYVADAPGGIRKMATAAEVREKSAAGCRLVSNFEFGAVPPNTVQAGKDHANIFLQSPMGQLGPEWAPCLYSVDTSAGAGAFNNYAHGWADVLGPERCGVYGDGALYRDLLRQGLVSYAWQSMSLSFPGNSDHTGANIVQTGRGTVAGHAVDFNNAMTPLYGSWLIGEENPSMPMTLNAEDQAWIVSTIRQEVFNHPQFTPDTSGAYTQTLRGKLDAIQNGESPSGTTITDADVSLIVKGVATLKYGVIQ